MLAGIYFADWYGENVSKPIWHQRTSVRKTKGSTVGYLTAAFAAHLPHIALGGAPYLMAVSIAAKAEKASKLLEIYNLAGFARWEYLAHPSRLLSKWFLGSALPTKQQAKAAVKVVRRASRVVPVLWGAALAYDAYDIVFNRSFWGIQFGNPTPGLKWWE